MSTGWSQLLSSSFQVEPYYISAIPANNGGFFDPHIPHFSGRKYSEPDALSLSSCGLDDDTLDFDQELPLNWPSFPLGSYPGHPNVITKASGNLRRKKISAAIEQQNNVHFTGISEVSCSKRYGIFFDAGLFPAQSDVDLLFQKLRNSLVDGSANAESLRLLSVLRSWCNDLDKLPSALYLSDVRFPGSGWPQAVGGGSFSDVYRALKGELKVAVKVLRTHQNNDEKHQKNLKKRFHSEALLWASCKHEFILPFLGVDTRNFQHGMCLVLPWMEHGKVLCKLKSWREENDAFGSIEKVDTWISQIAEGLVYLHSLGIIHGDLRAANILLDENYNIKLSDFGLSMVADGIISQATTMERTPNWIAPELVNPEKFGGKSSKPTLAGDIYAFGCVTIELYTGNPPYPGLQSYQVINKIMAAEPIPRPRFWDEPLMMPSFMWITVGRCLSQNPTSRPSASDIPNLLSVSSTSVRQLFY